MTKPFSDKLREGHFFNMHNNKRSLQIWERSQPNTGRDENFGSVAMVDVAQTTFGCSSYLVSTMMLLRTWLGGLFDGQSLK